LGEKKKTGGGKLGGTLQRTFGKEGFEAEEED